MLKGSATLSAGILTGYLLLDIVSEKEYRRNSPQPSGMQQQAANQGGRTIMSSLKRWRQIGQGQFHKWEVLGDALEGVWRGIHEGRFGPLGTVETVAGLVTSPLHAA